MIMSEINPSVLQRYKMRYAYTQYTYLHNKMSDYDKQNHDLLPDL